MLTGVLQKGVATPFYTKKSRPGEIQQQAFRFWWQNRPLGPGNTVVLVTSLGGTQPTLPCALAGQEEFVLEKGSETVY